MHGDFEAISFAIERIIKEDKYPHLVFHGGEPLLIGKETFQRLLALIERESKRHQKEVKIALQTNASLIDDEWCAIFKQAHINPGVSYDGRPEFQRKIRSSLYGIGTLKGMDKLRAHGVNFSVLVVISSYNQHAAKEIYQHLRKDLNLTHWDYLPCVEKKQGSEQYLLNPESYGLFLLETFEAWLAENNENIKIRTFENIINAFIGVGASLCRMKKGCSDIRTLDVDGSIYSCDRFAGDEKYQLGSFSKEHFFLDYERIQQIKAFTSNIPSDCNACEWIQVCQGGCHQHQILGNGRDHLCNGYKITFRQLHHFLASNHLLKGGNHATAAK